MRWPHDAPAPITNGDSVCAGPKQQTQEGHTPHEGRASEATARESWVGWGPRQAGTVAVDGGAQCLECGDPREAASQTRMFHKHFSSSVQPPSWLHGGKTMGLSPCVRRAVCTSRPHGCDPRLPGALWEAVGNVPF